MGTVERAQSSLTRVLSRAFELKPQAELVTCWSGGKDSTALLLLLATCRIRPETPVKAVCVPYPRACVAAAERSHVEEFWASRGVNLLILEHEHADPDSLPYNQACFHCKSVRRGVLWDSFFAGRDLENTIVLTGHSSWDLAAYLTELAVGRLTGATTSRDKDRSDRYLEIMNKFFPLYSRPGGPIIIRPLLEYGDPDIMRLIEAHGVPFPIGYIKHECPWLNQRKRILHRYFEASDLRFDFEQLQAYARKEFGCPASGEYDRLAFCTYLL